MVFRSPKYQSQNFLIIKFVNNTPWILGSTISLITFKKAKQLGLKGKPVRLNVSKVGEVNEALCSYVYHLPLIDLYGNLFVFKVCGFETISGSVFPLNISKVIKIMNVDEKLVYRPKGEIDILIGFDYAGFHPKIVRNFEHLVLMKCRLWYCLGGRHPSL